MNEQKHNQSQNNQAAADKLRDMLTKPVGRLLWEYSLPTVVGMVVMSLYNVIDRIFIGRGVGSDAIAGLTITFPVMNLAAALGVLIGAGAGARISIMLGAQDRDGAQRVLGNALTMILVNGVIYISLFAIFVDPILRAFGASDATLPYARDFILHILPGMLITNITFSFNNIMRASGYPRRAMVTMFIGAGANLVLAPIFIFALDMGISGAAIATDIAMAISAFFVLYHFFDRRTELRFRRGIYRPDWKIVGSIMAIGAAPSLVNMATSAVNAIINTSLMAYGDNAVAAAGIFTTYASLLGMVMLGMCQGMQPIVGYSYGAGHPRRAISTFWLTVRCASVVAIIGCAVGLSFPRAIASVFTVDTGLIDVTANALSIALIMYWIVGFQMVTTNFFMSIGKAGRSIFLSLTRQVLFLIPMLLILPRHFGLSGIWASFPAADVISTLLSAAMIAWELRRLRLTHPTGA